VNTNGKGLLAGVGAVVALSSVAYFLIKADSSQPAQPTDAHPTVANIGSPDRSARNTVAPSVPAQYAGVPFRAEAKSLHTEFRDLYRCYSNLKAVDAAKSRGDCSFYGGKPLFEKAYAECLARAQDEANAMHSAESSMQTCPANEGTLINDYYKATKDAARDGNVDAQYCYLFSYFQDSQDHSHYTQQDTEDYKADSAKYVADAFARGDWRIVSLLSTRFIDPPRSLVTLLDGIGQPETTYKMKKLLRLGATGDYAASLDEALGVYRRPAQNGSRDSLSKDTVAAADKWAQETYERHFQGQQPLTEEPRAVCRPTE
jgi:hypothetical protein